jgi:pseudaminic acid cytidylyltransferase
LYKQYQIIALICCRGGSKGIPKKNIRRFCGKPLLGWILEAASSANVFDDIILSTDSEEIAAIGGDYGVKIPELRPKCLAQDNSDQFDTHKYIFDLLEVSDSTHRVCNLNNNPFIDSNIIKEGYQKSIEVDFQKIVLDTLKIGGDFTFFRQCYRREGQLKYLFPLNMLESQINRQTFENTYTAISNMRWGKPSVLNSYEKYKEEVVAKGFLPVELPKTRNFDLDDEDDWTIAEAVFNKLFTNN